MSVWFGLCVSCLCPDAFARLQVSKVGVDGLVQVCFEYIGLRETDKQTHLESMGSFLQPHISSVVGRKKALILFLCFKRFFYAWM